MKGRVVRPVLSHSEVRFMEEDLLTAEQLADRLGVKPGTIRNWFRAGLIPAIRLSPKVIRFNLVEVVGSLQERQAARGSMMKAGCRNE